MKFEYTPFSRAAIITDIHFDCRGGSQYFLDKYNEFFEKQFFPELDALGIKTIICLGDTWENRKSVNVNSLHFAKRMFFDKIKERGIELICILGNHDVFYKNTNDVNSMEIIESAYENVKLVENTETITIGETTVDLVSWINSENYKERCEFIKNSPSDICAGHFEINGFEMTQGHYCETGVSMGMFSHYQSVWSGHFHIKSTRENVTYLGNPFQTNRGDTGFKRGYHIFDGNTRELTFVENKYNIYESVKFSDDVDLLTFDFNHYANKIVIIDIESLLDCNTRVLNLFSEKLSAVAYKVEINETVGHVTTGETVEYDSMKTHSDLMNEYIETVTPDSEKQTVLKDILHTLYNDAVSAVKV